MPDYAIAFLLFGAFALAAWLLMRWANKKLSRTRMKYFPAFSHGGFQAQLALLCVVAAVGSLVIGFTEL